MSEFHSPANATTVSEAGRFLTTGIEALDRRIGGIPRGNLTVVAGRTGNGKSAFALQLLAHGARLGRIQVVEAGEMRGDKVTILVMAQLAGLSRGESLGTHGGRTQEATDRLGAVAGIARAAPLFIRADPSVRLEDVTEDARQVRSRRGGLDLIIIDGWSHVASGCRRRAPAALAGLAREFDCAVVLTAHLPTAIGRRRPGLDDFRDDDKALVADAGLVLILSRPNAWDANDPNADTFDHDAPEDAEIVVGKARGAEVGVVPVQWRGRECRYV